MQHNVVIVSNNDNTILSMQSWAAGDRGQLLSLFFPHALHDKPVLFSASEFLINTGECLLLKWVFLQGRSQRKDAA